MGKLSFGATGLSYQPDKVALNVGGAPKCPRCKDRVYFNEEKKALGKSWHTRCFSCADCKKRLDSTTCAEHDGEIYCVRCHRKEFGPKGYGFAGGMAGLSTESTYHDVRPVDPLNHHTVAQHIPSQEIQKDNPDCCPRCGKKVFFAEEVKGLRRKWHRLCFKCTHCSKILEPGRCSEHETGVYCKNCYGKLHGPTGYGYAGGMGTLLAPEPHPEYNHMNGSHPDHKPFANMTNFTEEVPMPPMRTDMRSSIAGSHEWTEGVMI